jgi:hypothetical protein
MTLYFIEARTPIGRDYVQQAVIASSPEDAVVVANTEWLYPLVDVVVIEQPFERGVVLTKTTEA